jgi:peptidoglycan/LPS O-acetylase OafA/YrhL
MTGGFVGVDIFFVISGYLIIRNILKGIQIKQFTFRDFYLRRIRRLYPTYITVIAACATAAWIFLIPGELDFFGTSLISTVFYSSNFTFWAESGYFDIASELKPLLHTWSLSVEEQFYLVFPAAIVLFSIKRLSPKLLLSVIFVLSFLGNILFIGKAPAAVFFLSPFRMWEFAFGGFIAAGMYPAFQKKGLHLLLLLLGLAMVFASIFGFNTSFRFPGFWALMPVLGTTLVIGSSALLQDHLVLRVLTFKPIVYIGLMSYALYLWHWPVLVFYKFYTKSYQPSIASGAFIIGLTVVLSWVSTFVAEPPIRRGKVPARWTLIGAAVFSLCFLALGLSIKASHGASFRYTNAHILTQTKINEEKIFKQTMAERSGCDDLFRESALTPEILKATCSKFGTGKKIDFILWGDSHVGPLGVALASKSQFTFLIVMTNGCPPITGVRVFDLASTNGICNHTIQSAFVSGFKKLAPKHIIIAARWTLYTHGWYRGGIFQKGTPFVCDSNCSSTADAENSAKALQRQFTPTMKELGSFTKVLVVKGMPELKMDGEKIALLPKEKQSEYLPTKEEHYRFQAVMDKEIDAQQNALGYAVFDPSRHLCEGSRCQLNNGRRLCYLDDNHLTISCWSGLLDEILKTMSSQ